MAGPDGTAARPYASIGQALANMAGKSRVYVCNGVYAEQVSITARRERVRRPVVRRWLGEPRLVVRRGRARK